MSDSNEEKVPTPEQTEKVLQWMAPKGSERVAVPIGKDEDGNTLGFITWRKP